MATSKLVILIPYNVFIAKKYLGDKIFKEMHNSSFIVVLLIKCSEFSYMQKIVRNLHAFSSSRLRLGA